MKNYAKRWVRRVEVMSKTSKDCPVPIYFKLSMLGRSLLDDKFQKDRYNKVLLKLSERPEQTVEGILKEAVNINFKLVHNENIRRNANGLMRFIISSSDWIRHIPDVLALIINLMLLFFYDPGLAAKAGPQGDTLLTWFWPGPPKDYRATLGTPDKMGGLYGDNHTVGVIMFVLPLVHLITELLKLGAFVKLRAPILAFEKRKMLNKAVQGLTTEERAWCGWVMNRLTTLIPSSWYSKAAARSTVSPDGKAELPDNVDTSKSCIDKIKHGEDYSKWFTYGVCFQMLRIPEVLSEAFFFIITAVAFLIHPLFYSVQLVSIFQFETAYTVFLSVTEHKEKLGMTLVILFLINYFFAVTGFLFFWNYHADYTKTCSTLWQCFLTYVCEGLKSDGISDAMRDTMVDDSYPVHLWSDGHIFAFVLWDTLYFMLVVLILVAIVTGVIIDTFSELRDKGNEEQGRLKGECIMCGLAKDELALRGKKIGGPQGGAGSFKIHIDEEHSLWSYIGYFMYLEEQNSQQDDTMTTHEMDIHKSVFKEDPDTEFMPIGKAKRLHGNNNEKDEKKESLAAEMGKVTNSLGDLMKEVKSLKLQEGENVMKLMKSLS